MEATFTVLVVGSDPRALAAMGASIEARGHVARIATSIADGVRIHRDEGAELVILVLPLVDGTSAATIRLLRAQDPRLTLIVSGKDADVQGAPDALQLGAVEYVSEVRDPHELLSIIGLASGARRTDAQLRFLRQKDASSVEFQTIVGQCTTMRQLFARVRQVCQRTALGGSPIILISGETGTGKGMLAKSIHYNSARRSRAFVDLNCAAIPASLIEAELFGHERGAFTDARSARPGLFETADGGTLFLDEIGSMPLDLQAKLLTAIEEKRVRRLGGQHAKQVDIQVIAATHRDLASMVATQEFRADLYHRLNVLALELPPLRERGEDKLLLARSFVRAMCQQYGITEKKLDEAACVAIERYAWPGNVRELHNQLERIVMLEDADVIESRHFHFATTGRTQGGTDPARTADIVVTSDAGELSVSLPLHGVSLDAIERAILRQVLERAQGNVSSAARYLSISRQTMIYRMKKYRLGGTDLEADER